MRGLDHYVVPVGGLVSSERELGARVDADESGVFWRPRRLQQVAVSEYVCSIGIRSDEYCVHGRRISNAALPALVLLEITSRYYKKNAIIETKYLKSICNVSRITP